MSALRVHYAGDSPGCKGGKKGSVVVQFATLSDKPKNVTASVFLVAA